MNPSAFDSFRAMNTPIPPEDLEKSINRLLRDLPERQAPRNLEMRVMAAIAKKAARPWWQRSFTEWPAGLRLAFVVTSAIAVAVVMAGGMRLVGGVQNDANLWEAPLHWWQHLSHAAQVIGGLVTKQLPQGFTQWLYVGAGVLAAVYAVGFGLASAAYRYLWKSE